MSPDFPAWLRGASLADVAEALALIATELEERILPLSSSAVRAARRDVLADRASRSA